MSIVKSAIIGQAVGDALGVPVEFSSRDELDEEPVTRMMGHGTYNVPAGSWSDDTSMTLCALEAYTHDEFSFDTVMQNFGKWYYDDEFNPEDVTFDIGNTCRTAINNYCRRHMDTDHCGLSDINSNGNGSLMRIMPFALFSNDIAFIEKASALTHANRRSQIACGIYAYIVWELMRSADKAAVKTGLAKAKEHYSEETEYKYYTRLENIEKLPRSEIKSGGYVVDTLEAALYCLLTTDTYKDCVLAAVNLGGDTDTTADVAGGLAGLLYGYDAIPSEWRSTLLKREWIEDMCEKAEKRMH